MKVYGRFKVVSVSEEVEKKIGNKTVPCSYVILNEGDSYLTATVWGNPKIQICKEKLYSETDMECVVSITGSFILRDDGSKRYFNNFNIIHIL